jgi:hypothetical protein
MTYTRPFPRSLSQNNRLRQACTVKQTPESHSHTCVQGRADPKRQSGKRMSTVQYARLGKENGSSESARAKQVKWFGCSASTTSQWSGSGCQCNIRANASRNETLPGKAFTFRGGGLAAKREP